MTYNEISAMLADESSDIVYLSDPDTYEIYYLNRAALERYHFTDPSEWLGKPCYQILQSREAPCEFCTNKLLKTEKFYVWQHFNEQVGRHYLLKDKLIELDGRPLRMEIATDTTERELVTQQLRQRLLEEETLIDCIQTLNSSADAKTGINRLLEIIAGYHQAERAYIFEIDAAANEVSNTYEWCRPGIREEIDNLQKLPLSCMDRWIKQFREKGEFYITSLNEMVPPNTKEYEILFAQDIESLMAAPLADNGEIVGILGVDNPHANTDSVTLLRSVASFVVNDIARRKMTERLTDMSYTDSLTGLGNRRAYIEEMGRLEQAPPRSLGVVYLDINGLKLANDTHGHRYGDHIICHAASVLRGIFRKNLYRVGGDEFVAICVDIDRERFDNMVRELRLRTQDDDELKISIGANWHEDKVDIARQIAHADNLMYIDKQKYYGMRLDGMGKYHMELSKKLMADIEKGRYVVYLQPKVCLKSGALCGAEALVRYQNAQGGVELPRTFIPRFETEGIIRHIDLFVLDTVCAALEKWQNEGGGMLPVAVNLSRVTLLEYDIVSKLVEACARHGVPPENIIIEVTESINMMEQQELRELVMLLSQAGFLISLDDFGSEYSNLSILTQLKFDEIKIDRSLIEDLEHNPKSRVITQHTIQMCRELDLRRSVAEGIETAAQRKLLEQYDCTTGQGYYFDPPMPIEEFAKKYIAR
ncbi:sensor domain-containing protein [Agathobaculum sp.]|uniref:sensor domain-containing protein n=1 Tax=Agathobaculum sp. TaxID=2048138 RepID=UPI002A7ED193|nr:GGDEF domain-containing protein [Agathobaculum sp.]MDY3618452.1 GGDEF domain-containing protein [Agathobaculum sp.]